MLYYIYAPRLIKYLQQIFFHNAIITISTLWKCNGYNWHLQKGPDSNWIFLIKETNIENNRKWARILSLSLVCTKKTL